MDAQEQLVLDSEKAVCVLGNGSAFMLVELDREVESAKEAAIERGFEYCGVMCVVRGQAVAQCEPRPDCWLTMMHAALAFTQLVADRLRPHPKGDALAWLEALYRLPDTRN